MLPRCLHATSCFIFCFFSILSLFYLCSYLVVLLMCFSSFVRRWFLFGLRTSRMRKIFIYTFLECSSFLPIVMAWSGLFFVRLLFPFGRTTCTCIDIQTNKKKRDKAWAGNRVKIKRQTDKPRQAWIANSNWIIILNSLKCSQYTLSWYWCDRVAIVAMVCERKLWPSIDLQTHTKKGNKKSHTHRHKCTECIQGWTVHLSLQEINRTIGYRDLIARSLRSAWSKFIIFMH